MLDLWIVGVFLLVTLVIGIWQGKGITSLSVFSIAERKYPLSFLIATITATWLGGSAALGSVERVYSIGTVFFFILLAEVIARLLIAEFIAPHIDKFNGCISIGDIMERLYGKRAKIITGLAGGLLAIAEVGAQVAALGYIFHYFLHIEYFWGIIISCGIITIYSSAGGMKAVTITDVLQFAVLIVAIPMICNIGVMKIGGYEEMFRQIPQSHLTLSFGSDFKKYSSILILFLIPGMGPYLVQRLLMAKNGEQAQKAFRYTAFIGLGFYIAIIVIALCAVILNPSLKNSSLAMPYLVNEVLPSGLKGVAIAGLLAIVMSSADSQINAGSVSLVHDFLKPLLKKNLSNETELRLARIFSGLIGIFAIVSAIWSNSIFEIVIISKMFWRPVVTIPFIIGVIGYKVNKKSFIFGASSGAITAILWKLLALEKASGGIGAALPAMLANIIFFFGSHYYYKLCKPERFKPIPDLNINEPIEGKKKSLIRNSRLSNIISILSEFRRKLTSKAIVNFSSDMVDKHGAQYQAFAIFMVLNYIIPIFMWSANSDYFDTLASLRLVSGLLCVGLILAPELSKKFKKSFAIYWYLTLTICLPLTSTLMVILNNGKIYWLFNMALSVCLLTALVDSLSFILIFSFGSLGGYLLTKTFYSEFIINLSKEDIALGAYMVGFSVIIGLIFFRRREGFIEQKLNTLKALGGSIAHELRTPIAALNMYATTSTNLNDKLFEVYKIAHESNTDLPKLSRKEIQNLNIIPEQIQKVSSETLVIIDMLLTKLKDPSQESQKEYHSIKETIKSAIDLYPLHDSQKSLIHLNLEQDFVYYGNSSLITHIIFNLLKNSLYYLHAADKGEIFVTLARDKNSNRVMFKDTGQGVTQEQLPNMFEKFYSKSNGGTGLGLAFCKMTMEELGGTISCHSIYGEYIEFIMEFPAKPPDQSANS